MDLKPVGMIMAAIFLLGSLAEASRRLEATAPPWSESSAGEPAAAGRYSARPARLKLAWFDGHKLFKMGFGAMAREVQAIFQEIGVEVVWEVRGPRPLAEPVPEGLKVVLLPSDPSGWGLPGDVMGVVMGQEFPRRTAYLFFHNVARTLGYSLDGVRLPRPRQTNELARALGRVIVHETIHALAPGHPHDPRGLMSSELTRNLLLEPRLRLDPGCAAAFLSGLAAERARLTGEKMFLRRFGERAGEGARKSAGFAFSSGGGRGREGRR